ncbi:hypothetical protein Fcan01_20136 [Folsomia candida]|uniref:Uncharacterized protein n=1 Tax=Folsomia candida TaxID=158441 RepID=A0A226DJT4_FOLCA|nr:hypothetical protein Fcan01_20136 [Folsomia candida]
MANPRLIELISDFNRQNDYAWRVKSSCRMAVLNFQFPQKMPSKEKDAIFDGMIKTLLTNRNNPDALLIHGNDIKFLVYFHFHEYALSCGIGVILRDSEVEKATQISMVYLTYKNKRFKNSLIPLDNSTSENFLETASTKWTDLYKNLNLVPIYAPGLQKKYFAPGSLESNCYKVPTCVHVTLSRHFNYTPARKYFFTASTVMQRLQIERLRRRFERAFSMTSHNSRLVLVPSEKDGEPYTFQIYTKSVTFSYTALVKPYSVRVWVLICGTFLVTCVALDLIRYSRIIRFDTIFWAFSILIEQFSEIKTPQKWRKFNMLSLLRVISVFYFFAILYVNNLYKGDLYSLIMYREQPSDIPTTFGDLYLSSVKKVSFEAIHEGEKTYSFFKRIIAKEIYLTASDTAKLAPSYKRFPKAFKETLFKRPLNIFWFAANLSKGISVEMEDGEVLEQPEVFAYIGGQDDTVPRLTASFALFKKYRVYRKQGVGIFKMFMPWTVDGNFFSGIFKKGFFRLVEAGFENRWIKLGLRDKLWRDIKREMALSDVKVENLHSKLFSSEDTDFNSEAEVINLPKLYMALVLCAGASVVAGVVFGLERSNYGEKCRGRIVMAGMIHYFLKGIENRGY